MQTQVNVLSCSPLISLDFSFTSTVIFSTCVLESMEVLRTSSRAEEREVFSASTCFSFSSRPCQVIMLVRILK